MTMRMSAGAVALGCALWVGTPWCVGFLSAGSPGTALAAGDPSRLAQSQPQGQAPAARTPTTTGQSAAAGQVRNAPGRTSLSEAAQKSLVDKVSGYLSGMQTLVGSFIQIGPDGGRTEGTFYIQKPGKVRFEYDPPSPIDVIADGSSVVVRDRKLATQDLYPLSQTPLRYLLVDKIDLMKDTKVVQVSADDVFVTVVIEERHAVVGTHKLLMMFGAKDMQLRQWTVTDPQGFDTTVAVYNLTTGKKPDPSLFKIEYERVLQ